TADLQTRLRDLVDRAGNHDERAAGDGAVVDLRNERDVEPDLRRRRRLTRLRVKGAGCCERESRDYQGGAEGRCQRMRAMHGGTLSRTARRRRANTRSASLSGERS